MNRWKKLKYAAVCASLLWFVNALPSPAIANTAPPTPTQHFYGDGDGDLLVTGLDIIQHNNYILNKPHTYDTLQPDTVNQRWNTCDLDSDRVCT